MREVKEETELTVLKQNGQCIMSQKRENDFCDIWLFRQDFTLQNVVFQPEETCGARYATMETILEMRENGTLVPFGYLDEFFEKVRTCGLTQISDADL